MVAAEEGRVELVILLCAFEIALDAALASILKHRIVQVSLVNRLRCCLDRAAVKLGAKPLPLFLLVHEAELLQIHIAELFSIVHGLLESTNPVDFGQIQPLSGARV